ncbi:MAG: hypothetical protein FJ042_05690 [Candidatus Cloacimonetes bacterium]|nr:hypothetical protein [Candidatus Cloacimonadota bacterium]
MFKASFILLLLTTGATLTAQQTFDINRFSDPAKYGWQDWFDRINYRNDLIERQKLLQLYENNAQSVNLNVGKSALIPGWGQYSTGDYTKGHIFLGTELVLIGISAYYYDRAMYNYQKYLDATQVLEIENFYKKAQGDYQFTLIFVGLASLVWLFNVYDVVHSTEAFNADLWQRVHNDYYKAPLKLTPTGIEIRF